MKRRVRVHELLLDGAAYKVIAAGRDDLGDLPLTPSELEVALAAASGLSNRQIARRRKVAERTIANQLAVIYQKLSIGSRFELVSLLSRR